MTLKKDQLVKGEPIQWHLRTTKHDKCPDCGGPLGYLSQRRRMCLGDCGKTGKAWNLGISTTAWLKKMREAGK